MRRLLEFKGNLFKILTNLQKVQEKLRKNSLTFLENYDIIFLEKKKKVKNLS